MLNEHENEVGKYGRCSWFTLYNLHFVSIFILHRLQHRTEG